MSLLSETCSCFNASRALMVIAVVVISACCINLIEIINSENCENQTYSKIKGDVFVNVVVLIAFILLLIGIVKKLPNLLIPSLVAFFCGNAFAIGLTLQFLYAFISDWNNPWALVGVLWVLVWLIASVFGIITWIGLFELYKKLRDEKAEESAVVFEAAKLHTENQPDVVVVSENSANL